MAYVEDDLYDYTEYVEDPIIYTDTDLYDYDTTDYDAPDDTSFWDDTKDYLVGDETSPGALDGLSDISSSLKSIADPFITYYNYSQAIDANKTAQENAEETARRQLNAAIDNNQWKVTDDEYTYLVNQSYDNSIRDNVVTGVYNTLNSKTDSLEQTTDLKNILNTELANADIAKLKDQSLASMKLTAAKAKVDMEYTIALAQSAADYNTTKAVIDSVNYYKQAQASVVFMDRDIATIRKDLNRTAEAMDVATAEAIGKVSNSVSNTLTAGSSVARRVMDTVIKSDMLRQEKVAVLETGLAKAYATQDKTATEAGSSIQTTMNTAISQNTKINQDAITNLTSIIGNAKSTTDNIIEAAEISMNYVAETTAANNSYLNDATDIEIAKLRTDAAEDVRSTLDAYDAKDVANTANQEYSKYATMRAREEIYRSMVSNSSTNAQGVSEYVAWLETDEGASYQADKAKYGWDSEPILTQTQIEDAYVSAKILGDTVPTVISNSIDSSTKATLDGTVTEYNENVNNFFEANKEVLQADQVDEVTGKVTPGFSNVEELLGDIYDGTKKVAKAFKDVPVVGTIYGLMTIPDKIKSFFTGVTDLKTDFEAWDNYRDLRDSTEAAGKETSYADFMSTSQFGGFGTAQQEADNPGSSGQLGGGGSSNEGNDGASSEAGSAEGGAGTNAGGGGGLQR